MKANASFARFRRQRLKLEADWERLTALNPKSMLERLKTVEAETVRPMPADFAFEIQRAKQLKKAIKMFRMGMSPARLGAAFVPIADSWWLPETHLPVRRGQH